VARIFTVRPDRVLQPQSNIKELNYHVGLPSVACESCGRTWSMTGPSFPEVDLPHDIDPEPFLDPAAVSAARLKQLTEMVRALFPPGTALYPGTAFGPAWARLARLKVPLDFVFDGSWTLLSASPAGAAALDDCGVKSVQVEIRGKIALDLREASLPMFGLIDDMVDPSVQPCDVCGYVKLLVPPVLRMALPADDIPAIFRGANAPNIVFATDRFVDIVQERNLKGLVFTPIESRQH
jgi:hypothetical protein